MSETLVNKLNRELDNFSNKKVFLYPPSCILVHPDTYIKLMDEFKTLYRNVGDFMLCSKTETSPQYCKYLGIPIYRSPDVQENQFLIF